MYDTAMLAAIAATFLLAGAVKGVIGLGLPTVSLALLTVLLGLPQAMALLLVPSFVTNLWQGVVGGHGLAIVRKIWPFLLLATATVWLGAGALARIEAHWLSALLGLLIAIYAGISLAGWRLAIDRRQNRWAGPLAGLANGVLTGMTGSFVVPGAIYLQALGLSRDALVQAMGIAFTASTLALAIALQGHGRLNVDLGLVSTAGVLPAILGMVIGQRIRGRLSERRFRKVFFSALLLLGLYIVIGAPLGRG